MSRQPTRSTVASFAALALGVSMCCAAETMPKAPRYVTPPFDTKQAALAIAQVQPRGGTAVVISQSGLVLTAYHVISPCVAHLRRDPAVGAFFHDDGSYSGEHGPLLCQGVTLRLRRPSCTDAEDVDNVEHVYLLAVPPVRRADAREMVAILDPAFDPTDPPVSPADFALLRIDHPVTSYLRLSPDEPTAGEPTWTAGYLMFSQEALLNPESYRQDRISIEEYAVRKALFGILAEVAINPDNGIEAARTFLKDRRPPTGPDAEWIAEAQKEAIANINSVAKGPAEAVAVVRKCLDAEAAKLQRLVDSPDTQPEVVTYLDGLASNLRCLRESVRGSEVRRVMLALASHHAETEKRTRWDYQGDRSMLSEYWCTIPAFFGPITQIHDSTLRTGAFVGMGMSGGPVLNASGDLIGVMMQGQRLLVSYAPDNLVAVRADTILREFGPLLKATESPQPTAGN